MKLNDSLLYKISRYVRGQLPENEALVFEKEMGAQKELQEYVNMARFEMDTMEYLLEEDLREEISKWENEPPPSGNDKKRDTAKKWWFGLLAIALLVCLFCFMENGENKSRETTPTKQESPKNESSAPIAKDEDIVPEKTYKSEKKEPASSQPESNNNLYLAYAKAAYSIPDNLNNLKGSADKQKITTLSKGIQAFKGEDFKTAVKELESINPKSPFYGRAKELLAHAYFKNGQYEKAAVLFQAIANESRFNKDEPEWYLLLSYIANYANKKTQADALLEKISRDELHNYQRNALQLEVKMKFLDN